MKNNTKDLSEKEKIVVGKAVAALEHMSKGKCVTESISREMIPLLIKMVAGERF